ncbi:MAG: hypothetical protein ABSG18_19405 [Steroidobacteraceae bacterium]
MDPGGWQKKKAKREKQRQPILATLTAAGRERVGAVLPAAHLPQTLADVARYCAGSLPSRWNYARSVE